MTTDTYVATYPTVLGRITREFPTELQAHDWLRRIGHTSDGGVYAMSAYPFTRSDDVQRIPAPITDNSIAQDKANSPWIQGEDDVI